MKQSIHEWTLWNATFKKFEVINRPYHLKYLKARCISQILLNLFLNTVSYPLTPCEQVTVQSQQYWH